MSENVPPIESIIAQCLSDIGLDCKSISIDKLAATGSALLVTVVSDDFEGLTYLDREMRARPAIARALSIAGQHRVEFVVEPLCSTEMPTAEPAAVDRDEFLEGETIDTSLNRAGWRDEIKIIVAALENSAYEIEVLEDQRLYHAQRTGVSTESILLAFAISVTAKTVDLETRSAMERARSAKQYSACVYISPTRLRNAYANQRRAKWLDLETTNSFLHKLNASTALAKNLLAELDRAISEIAPQHKGEIIDPEVYETGRDAQAAHFQGFVQQWMTSAEPSLLVVMAPAGHGKTTLCQELTRKLSAHFANEGSPHPVAVMVPFESVRRVVDFESLLFRRLGELRSGSLSPFVSLLQRGEALLVVDGFDELANDAGFEVAENQVRSMRFLFGGRARVILAGRSLFTEDFSASTDIRTRMRALLGDIKVDVIEIGSFGEDDIEKYVQTRTQLTEPQRESVRQFYKTSPDHGQLASNPLFLKILCSLAHSQGLANTGEFGSSIEQLIRQVCIREEDRHHLGIGIDRQLAFLRDVALEAFKSGRGVSREELELLAQFVGEGHLDRDPQLVGRLSDHALLNRRGIDRVDLIHPYIRDVLISQLILSDVSAKRYIEIGRHELPEASVQHIAASASADLFPPGWLSSTGRVAAPRARRNLFRIALASARRHGDVGGWFVDSWIADNRAIALDLSGLRLVYWSFSDITFERCDFSDSVLEDCDLRGARFIDCDVSRAHFVECRSDTATGAERCVFTGAVAVTRGQRKLIGSERPDVPLGEALVREASIHRTSRGDRQELRDRVIELIVEYLEQFVEVDPPKFHTKWRSELRLVGATDRERQVVEKVIASGIASRLCVTETAAGSQRTIRLDKRYQSLVVELIKSRALPLGLTERLAPTVMRGARMLE